MMLQRVATKPGECDTRIAIHDLSRLVPGDHIAWWRPEGYWHHALVEEVYAEQHQILVLHYNGPSPNGLVLVKGKVMQEVLNMGEEKGLLYKLNYESLYSVELTLQRARSRLGEDKYNILTHNCEHYVRWCKTGSESCVSFQVRSVYWTGFRIVQKVFTCLSKDVVKFGIGRYSAGNVYPPSVVTSTFKNLISWRQLAQFCEFLTVFFILLIELISMVLDIRRTYGLFRHQGLSKVEFVTIVFRRISQGTFGATGAVMGALIGQTYIPIPFLGSVIGSTLGAVLGHYIGHFEGYTFAYIQRKLFRDV